MVGREPGVDRDVVAARARSLRITGPVSGVSRRHVRVRLADGGSRWSTCTRRTAPSVHRRGAAEPERLTPGVPVVVTPGARVDVGRRWFRYESHRNP